ncbi:MAG: hypothetical protein U0W24_02885 [Bacteroidales bacterium]
MPSNKSFKIEWLIIGLLLIIIIIGTLFLISEKNKKPNETISVNSNPADSSSSIPDSKHKEILQKYEKLEEAYNTTILEIENAVEDDNLNLSILKENLNQILKSIKEQKNRLNSGNDSVLPAEDNTKQLEDLLNMSKEVLAERLLEEKNKNEKLTIDTRKLIYNLRYSTELYEAEKNKNEKLNASIVQINEQVESLELEGDKSSNELKLLNRQKEEVLRHLTESNKTLAEQNKHIQDLGEIIRKITIDCYYFYEKDNPGKEAKIYLTSQGISEKYVKYFVRKKPDIYVEFSISKDFMGNVPKKADLKLYNSLNMELYSVSKEINVERMKIIIPNKNFAPGKYSIGLMIGEENLLLSDKYTIRISN